MVSLLYLYLVPLRCLFQLLSSCRFLLCRASLNDSTDALHTEARSHPLRLCTDLTLCMLAFASTRMPYVNNQVGVKTKCLRCEQQESRTGCNCDLLQHQKHQTRFSEILFLQLIVIAIVAAAVVADLIAFFFITHNHFICSWMRWISLNAPLSRVYFDFIMCELVSVHVCVRPKADWYMRWGKTVWILAAQFHFFAEWIFSHIGGGIWGQDIYFWFLNAWRGHIEVVEASNLKHTYTYSLCNFHPLRISVFNHSSFQDFLF